MKIRSKKILIAIVIIMVVGVLFAIVIETGKNNVAYLGTGMVVHKEHNGDEYQIVVVSGKLEQTFAGKKIYDSFKIYDDIKVIIFEKRIFRFVYKRELYLTEQKLGVPRNSKFLLYFL